MSLMPEIERELLAAARESGQSNRRGARAEKSRRLTLRDRTLIVSLLAAVGIAVGVALLVLPGNGRNLSTSSAPQPPGSPAIPPRDAWWLGGRGCPLERRLGWARLPGRSGCVTIGSFDVNGDGRLDRILLYAHLSSRRAGQGFIPTYFTLEVLLTGGPKLTVRIYHPIANVTIESGGNVNGRPGAELFLQENRSRAHSFLLAPQRQLELIYSFDGHKLLRAGSFWWWGNSTQKYGITCDQHPPTAIVQHEFLRHGRAWRRIDTTYRWVGATLRRTTTTTTSQRGAPPQNLTTVDCRFA